MIYESLIDRTQFGLVQCHLISAHSPIRGIWLVKSKDLLCLVAAALEGLPNIPSAKIKLRHWFEAGQVEVLNNGDLIPHDAACEVLYYPPVYLMHLLHLDLMHQRNPTLCAATSQSYH